MLPVNWVWGPRVLRRRLSFVLPIFAIVLLAQFLAPIGAGFAMTAGFDARALGPVCAHPSADDADDRGGTPSPHACDDQCCALCQLAVGPPVALHPALIGLSNPPALYRLIVRYDADPAGIAAFVGDHSRARAPPATS